VAINDTRDVDLVRRVAKYYSEKVAIHGPTPKGADWNSRESQELRFEQLLRVCEGRPAFTLNDFGCGYGALARFMANRGLSFVYRGYDASEAMVAEARAFLATIPNCTLFTDETQLPPADYTVASGVFNVKLDTPEERWTQYVLDTMAAIARLSTVGFAFNLLTRYADPDRTRPDLYYADPAFFFDHCIRTYSRRVALLHDYPLYEFTIIVRLP
jgi:SAM-dependent methyltransferase